MKEKIKTKLDAHIDTILAKKEITNEEYCLLSMVYQKIESDERIAATEAKMDAEKEKSKEKMKEMQKIIDNMWN